MIRINHLWKSFGRQTVLRGISLEVKPGVFTALIGMSGSGKSLLLKHLVGLITPDQGSISIDGKELSQLSHKDLEELRSRIGFVFQSGALFDSMTVFDNVAFPLREKTKLTENEIREKVMDELSQVGLAEACEKYPAEISGGMLKRVALARALVRTPEIILFDEPTTGLDPIVSRSILQLFDEVHQRRKLTGILVSHEIPGIFDIVQQVAMLHEGTIIASGSTEEIRNSKDPVIEQFVNGNPEGPIRYR